jgi:DNA repair protein RadC
MWGTIPDTRVIFVATLKSCTTSIILAHNHPAVNLQPSQSDIDPTNKLKAAGKPLDIEVLDHIILAEDTYLSFADVGKL